MIRYLCQLPAFALFFLLAAGYAQAYGGPQELVPPQAALPEMAGLLKFILLLTFCIHLLLVNILTGTAVITLVRSLGGRSAPVLFSMQAETSLLPKVLALTVNFGVAPYLLVQVLYGSFLYPSTVLMALWWLSIIGFVMLSYYGLYIISDTSTQRGFPLRSLLFAIVIMLLFTMFLLATNSTLMLRPDSWERWLDAPHGTLLNIGDPTFFPRYLHFVIASLAVGGLVLAGRAQWKRNRQTVDAVMATEDIRSGFVWFRYASLIQTAVGIWFLFSLPSDVRSLFLGKSPIATSALLLVLTGLIAALYTSYKKALAATCCIVAGIVFTMVSIRDMVRDAMLAPYINTAPDRVVENLLPLPKGQTGAFILFLVCSLLAVAVLVYLARVMFTALRQSRAAAPGEK